MYKIQQKRETEREREKNSNGQGQRTHLTRTKEGKVGTEVIMTKKDMRFILLPKCMQFNIIFERYSKDRLK